jgi:hypothetical protein
MVRRTLWLDIRMWLRLGLRIVVDNYRFYRLIRSGR